MVRVKKGKSAHKKRRLTLTHTKGFRWGRKSKYKAAKDALQHAWEYAYRDRKTKKREFRSLWQTQISAGCRKAGMPYNKLIHGLKKNKIEIDRKILADLVKNHPQIFEKLLEKITEKK